MLHACIRHVFSCRFALTFGFACLVQITASLVLKWHVGRITALINSSYSYWFRNYGLNGCNSCCGIGFMELYGHEFRNLAGFIDFAGLPCVRRNWQTLRELE